MSIDLEKLKYISKQLKIPISLVPNFNNALYLRSNNNNDISKLYNKTIYSADDHPRGLIIGTPMLNDTILAHEAGHVLDKSIINGLAPKVENIVNNYKLPLLSTLAATTAGFLLPEYSKYIHAANILGNTLLAAPTLISEYNANINAEKHMDKLRLKPDPKKLDDLLYSHMEGQIKRKLLPAIIGAGAGTLINYLY